eukprot:GCRY01001676.1.p1 GENE.GCRY01001676.1~~GCRY01001676.1.p1  ORF type:complete len:227 (+),score=17.55 GCRY01001676.1:287-967(+)
MNSDFEQNISQIELGINQLFTKLRKVKTAKDQEQVNVLVKEKLRDLKREIDSMQFYSTNIERSVEKEVVLDSSKKHLSEYNRLSRLLKTLNLESFENIRQHQREEREMLLQGHAGESLEETRKRFAIAGALTSAQGITESLRRARTELHQQVNQSVANLENIDNSGSVLQKNLAEQQNLDSTAQEGHKLITKLWRREVTDQILFALAFLFFIAVVLSIIKNRIWDP